MGLSDKSSLDFGFPQGSALGRFGFKLYTKPITAIARKHNVQIHLYSDNTQLYLPFQPDQSEEAMKQLDACVEGIRQWMENNFLKLNDTKTEFIIFGTPRNVGKVVEWTVDVGDAIILPPGSVRNIGAMLNPKFIMETHITSMKRACYLQLRSPSNIRKYLSQEAAEKLNRAFITYNV